MDLVVVGSCSCRKSWSYELELENGIVSLLGNMLTIRSTTTTTHYN